ncbi:uncharacterized protein BDV14DRAFT_180958 [Aspergillus stella-maris]|uniref:uncharacterized protein n=1 Tax=Aspergillus stella-maris TaxID=1810926 RepID=UPI003CCDC0F6
MSAGRYRPVFSGLVCCALLVLERELSFQRDLGYVSIMEWLDEKWLWTWICIKQDAESISMIQVFGVRILIYYNRWF